MSHGESLQGREVGGAVEGPSALTPALSQREREREYWDGLLANKGFEVALALAEPLRVRLAAASKCHFFCAATILKRFGGGLQCPRALEEALGEDTFVIPRSAVGLGQATGLLIHC